MVEKYCEIQFGDELECMAHSSWTDVSGEELNKFVLLLLGCAVQGDKKKTFVSRITNLEKRLQEGIAKEIQKITESSSVVLSIDSLARYDGGVADHIEKLMEQRDAYAQTLYQVADTESDGGGSSTESSSVNGEVEIRRKIEKRPSELSEFSYSLPMSLSLPTNYYSDDLEST
ncbi:unnamed protein product [Nippostrongylus brasiliensis]|uniref:HOOK_N domain-containing protein n=1 Tax=Nippostrongylus brasiliensis TaxID=27835 RepID=A0A0N4XJ83_NIPBR|nr:unnamed protein product [Nippostrongylus brasiliensis]